MSISDPSDQEESTIGDIHTGGEKSGMNPPKPRKPEEERPLPVPTPPPNPNTPIQNVVPIEPILQGGSAKKQPKPAQPYPIHPPPMGQGGPIPPSIRPHICANPAKHQYSATSGTNGNMALGCGCPLPFFGYPSHPPTFPPHSNAPPQPNADSSNTIPPPPPGNAMFPFYTKFANPPCQSKSRTRKTGKKRKRSHCKRACVACRKAHTACDNNRPCNRCSIRGLPCQDDEESQPFKKQKTGWVKQQPMSSVMTNNFDHSMTLVGGSMSQQMHFGEGSKKDNDDPKSPVCFSNPSFKAIEESINELKEMNQLYNSILFRILNENFVNQGVKKEIEGEFQAGVTKIKMKEKLSLAIPVSIWDGNMKLIACNELFRKNLAFENEEMDLDPTKNLQNSNIRIDKFLYFEDECDAVFTKLVNREEVACFKIINVWKNRERQFDFVKSDFFRSRCGKYFWASHLIVSTWDRTLCLNEKGCKTCTRIASGTECCSDLDCQLVDGVDEPTEKDVKVEMSRQQFIGGLDQNGFRHKFVDLDGFFKCDEEEFEEEEDLNDDKDKGPEKNLKVHKIV